MESNTTTKRGTPPIRSQMFDGGILLTVWKNSGGQGTFYTVKVVKRYKPKGWQPGDNYEEASSFTGSDVLVAGRALEAGWHWVQDEKARERVKR